MGSDLPGEPADAADDADLFGGAFILGIELVVRDHPHGGRVAVRDMLEPLGNQPVLSEELGLSRHGCPASLSG